MPNFNVCKPLEYKVFVEVMKISFIILTDSGGVQEEAPALGKPVLVLRNETERPEAISSGVAKLIGTDTDNIVSEVQTLLDDKLAYKSMAKGFSPYGDGTSAKKIVKIIRKYYDKKYAHLESHKGS